MDALFRRDLELMEVIAAAEDAVVNARVDLEEAEDWLARAFSLRQPSRAALLPILPLLAARFPRSVGPLAGRVFIVFCFSCVHNGGSLHKKQGYRTGGAIPRSAWNGFLRGWTSVLRSSRK